MAPCGRDIETDKQRHTCIKACTQSKVTNSCLSLRDDFQTRKGTKNYLSCEARFLSCGYVRPAKAQISHCLALEYSMTLSNGIARMQSARTLANSVESTSAVPRGSIFHGLRKRDVDVTETMPAQ